MVYFIRFVTLMLFRLQCVGGNKIMKEWSKNKGITFWIILLVIIIIIKFNNAFYSIQSTNNTGNMNITGKTIVNKFQMIVKDTLPKRYSSGSYGYNNYVTVESLDYVFEDEGYRKVIKTYWSGVAGPSYKGSNYSTKRKVGYKLYDPTGLVIKSGTFYTNASLKENEIFKKDMEEMSFYNEDSSKLNQPGTYVLELMDTN